MPRYVVTLSSRQPLDQVFARMADFTNAQDWDPGVIKSLKASEGAVGTGSAFLLTVPAARKTMELKYVITEFEPNSLVTLQALTPRLESLDRLSFVSTATGCEMTYDATLRFRGIAILATPLLALSFRKIGDRARDSLKRYLDADVK
ncbi:MAG: SRPBCC family protein [Actinomycetota bacterium]